VLLENESLRIEVLPEFGGKISLIVALPSGTEMLQPQLRPVALRAAGLAFDKSDASGWDECLPTVAACILPGGEAMQDHGDLWRLPWDVLDQDATSVRMSVTATSLPLRFTRALRIEGSSLLLDYEVSNLSDRPAEYVWSAHPLFAVETGDRIVLPSDIKEVLVEGSGGQRLGAAGSRIAWPGPFRLDHVLAPDADVGDKLYAAAPAAAACVWRFISTRRSCPGSAYGSATAAGRRAPRRAATVWPLSPAPRPRTAWPAPLKKVTHARSRRAKNIPGASKFV
jgi:hypothetical protein